MNTRILTLATLSLTACLGPWPGTDDTTEVITPDDAVLGFVYSSAQNDGGWAQTHHEAATATAETFDIPLEFRPAVQSADVTAAIESLINDDGATIVYTTSSGYIGATLQAAIDYPDVDFFSCCGKAESANLQSYFGRMYQPIYLAGYIAGAQSCTEQLGVVAALPLPQFIRHINAFTLGAQAANPNIKVDVRYVGAFFNPQVEGDLAEELMDNGADVILAQSNSTEPLLRRVGETIDCDGEDTPIWRVGYHSPDACDANPTQCLTSAHWRWESLYESQVQSVFDGALDPTDNEWHSLEDSNQSVVDLAPVNASVSAQIRGDQAALRQDLVANPQLPFVGPLDDNTGARQINAGQVLSDEELDRMCYFVEGVIDTSIGEDAAAVVPSSCNPI